MTNLTNHQFIKERLQGYDVDAEMAKMAKMAKMVKMAKMAKVYEEEREEYLC